MVANMEATEKLGSGTDVDITSDRRNPALTETERNLLENQAIRADHGIGMNYDAIRMRDHQPATYFAVEGNIGTSHY